MVVHSLCNQRILSPKFTSICVDGAIRTGLGGPNLAKIKNNLNVVNITMSEQKLFGDMASDVLQKVGVDKLTKTYERLTGRPCNCANRRKALNNIHRMVTGQPVERAGRSIPQVARPPIQQYDPALPVDEQPPRK